MTSYALTIPAYAKLNLTLEVLGKRPDGYHELASIFQTISLHDTLCITPTGDGNLTLAVSDPDLQTPENLALRAAELLRAELDDATLGARIDLQKAIPVQGGLGGGSSDAAAVLLALDSLWHAGLSTSRLESLAARVGSDVPFFITGGTARIGGRGDVVTPLPDLAPLWFVLAKPPVSVSTAAIFRRVSPADYHSAAHTELLQSAVEQHQPVPFNALVNTLESIALAEYPEIERVREQLLFSGAPVVRMSGSGPTLYASFYSRADAEVVFERARGRNLTGWLCSSVSRDNYRESILGVTSGQNP